MNVLGFIRVEPFTSPEGEFPPPFFDLTIRPENTEPEVGFQAHYIPATWDKTTVKAFNLSPLIRPRHCERRALDRPSEDVTCT